MLSGDRSLMTRYSWIQNVIFFYNCSRFDMYCGCNSNIPFWKWLKVNQKFSLSIGCYDYNGLYLENAQPSNFYKCYGQY